MAPMDQAKFHNRGEQFHKADWDSLLGHCQAVTDTPCTLFYRELLAVYPDAKVVLTERDSPQQWFESQMKTIMPFFETQAFDPGTLHGMIRDFLSPMGSLANKFTYLLLTTSPMYRALWFDRRNGTQTAMRWYQDYNAEIKSLVPRRKLLVFNVKSGWAPLCEFLGEEIPNSAFPARNDTATFQTNIARVNEWVWRGSMNRAVYIVMAVSAVDRKSVV